jgi:hypothetical protein
MKINIKGFITHKEAELYSDCADRYAFCTKTNRFAIADGVSRSFFPAIWAELLVEKFVSLQIEEQFNYVDCQKEWLKKIEEIVRKPETKYYTKNQFVKNEAGLATFVSLQFDVQEKKWYASALGDSFLFFVPKNENDFEKWVKLSSKPEPVVFDNFPDYYSSRNNSHGEPNLKEGTLLEGTFYLMTDALSEWVFKEKEKSVSEIKNWKSQGEFECSVNELRKIGGLNNDDSAVLIIELQNDGKSELTYETVEVQDIQELLEKEKIALEQQVKEDEKHDEEQKKQSKEIANQKTSNNSEKQKIENTQSEKSVKTENTPQKFTKEENRVLSLFYKCLKETKRLHKCSKEKVLKEIRKKIDEYGIPFEN